MFKMVQEIITYIIVALAVLFVVSKTMKRLKGKKQSAQGTSAKNVGSNNHHDCSDCSAECMLRDATQITFDKNKDLCDKIEI